MTSYVFTPMDTLFFRDGRPYNQGDLNQADAVSHFPPHPPTIIGAFRAAAARNLGWQGRGDWEPDIKARLGDRSDLGPLSFSGPFLLYRERPVFPAPACLLGTKKTGLEQLTRVRPGSPVRCDLGTVRLPVPEQAVEGLKDLSGYWLTADGMQAVLDGKTPDLKEIVPESALFTRERRIGIERDPVNHTTKEGALYLSSHIRLSDNVALALQVQGLEAKTGFSDLIPLGGESRMAWVEPRQKNVTLPDPRIEPGEDGVVRYMAVFLSPALMTKWPGPQDSVAGMPGSLVCACQGRPVRIGGWDFQNGPQPLENYIPPGTTWFFEAEANDETLKKLHSTHGKHIGMRTEWGFGQVLIGSWDKE